MIVFPTEFAEYFNKKIHDFLHVEFIDAYRDEESIEILDGFFPDYLLREQGEKCLTTFKELFEWSGDKYWHKTSAFHEIGLYYFLEYMHSLREDVPEFDEIYYDAEDKQEIETLWKKYDIKAHFDGTISNTEDFAEFLHDLGTMQELCFEDADFLILDGLSNLRSIGDKSVEEIMGIDFNYYKDILPMDIRALHEKASSPFFSEIKEMLDRISHNISYRGLSESFWSKGEPRSEREIQPLFASLFDFYLKGDEFADITREADTGTGKIDFKFYKNPKEKVLIEIKLGSNPKLEHGLQKQLVHYMKSINYDDAFYLVICHSKEDRINIEKLYEKYRNYNFGKNITLYALDVSKKKTASKL